MGANKISKSTRKFIKTKLPKVLELRKEHKLKKKIQLKYSRSRKKSDTKPVVDKFDAFKTLNDESSYQGLDSNNTSKPSDDVDDFLENGFFAQLNELGENSDQDQEHDNMTEYPHQGQNDFIPATEEDKDEMELFLRDMEELKADSKQIGFVNYLKEQGFTADSLKKTKTVESQPGAEKHLKPLVTVSLLESWKRQSFQSLSVRLFSRLVSTFAIACQITSPNTYDTFTLPKFPFAVQDPLVFNDIVTFMFDDFHRLVKQLIPNQSKSSSTQHGSPLDRLGQNAYPLVKTYFKHLLIFLDALVEPKMIVFTLKCLEKQLPYLASFQIISKAYLKRLLQWWSSANQTIQAIAFLNIRTMCLVLPYPFINLALKGIYIYYTRTVGFHNKQTAATHNFMCNCVTELYGLDFVSSYQHAYIYLKELAIKCRQSYTSLKHDAVQSIYNFGFLNSLKVWVRILARYTGQDQLNSLIYPTVQLIQAVIARQPTNIHFPVRLHCLRMLNLLASSSKCFINSSAYLLEILQTQDMIKPPKKSMAKELSLNFLIKVPSLTIGTRIYQSVIFQEAIYLLIEYLNIYSTSIAFPELAVVCNHILRKFRKVSSNPLFIKQIKVLQDKMVINSRFIEAKRSQVEFSPVQVADMAKFVSDEPTPLGLYFDELRRNSASRQSNYDHIHIQNELEDEADCDGDDDEEDGEGEDNSEQDEDNSEQDEEENDEGEDEEDNIEEENNSNDGDCLIDFDVNMLDSD